MKLTEKQLKAAAKELNKVLTPEPPIDVTGDADALVEEIKDVLELIDPEKDEFTDATQAIVDDLSAPVAKKKTGKKVVEDKPEEEEEAQDAEDVELTVMEQIALAETKEELVAIVKENAMFKKIGKAIANFKKVSVLKQAMKDVVDEQEEPEEETPIAKAKAAKEEKKEKAPLGKAGVKGVNPFKKEPGTLSNQETMDKLLKEKADDKTILKAFTELYKVKGVTDPEFIKGRIAIYKKISQKGK